MPDPYWQKIGEAIAEKQKRGWLVCLKCGAYYHPPGRCEACIMAKCSRCGAKFIADGIRKWCPDCCPNRSETRDPLPGERLGGLADGKP